MKHQTFARNVVCAFVASAMSLFAKADTGVNVDGVDVSAGSGTGWAYEANTVTFTGAGPFVVSGQNTSGQVRLAFADREE